MDFSLAVRLPPVHAIPAHSDDPSQGRLVAYPDAEVTVASDTSGTVQQIRVHEKDRVRKGNVIAVLKNDDVRAALALLLKVALGVAAPLKLGQRVEVQIGEK